MHDDAAGSNRAAVLRLLAGLAGIAVTTIIGTAGVVAVYYPLRHAAFAYQWLLVFALMAGESAAIHLPSEVILPVGGWLVVREHHLGITGVLALSAIAAAGNVIGSGALYLAGRHGGRPLVRRYGRWLLIHESDIDAAERRMRPHHTTALFVSRLLPVVRTYVGFVAGILRVPPATFVAVTFAGSFVWSLAFVALGAWLGSNWDAVRLPAEVAGIAMLVAIAVALALWTAIQLRKHGTAPAVSRPRD
jgi:membrane protein DedA with SNARE-associated domain